MKNPLLLIAILGIVAACAPSPTTKSPTASAPSPTPAGPSIPADTVDLSGALACATSYVLPTNLVITRPTRIDVQCLTVPKNARVTVKDGGSLMIIATRLVNWRNEATISAIGNEGARGGNGVGEIKWTSQGHNDFTANGNPCRGESLHHELFGKQGASGTQGGNIRLLLANVVTSGPVGTLDVSGGPGGAPGSSGNIQCWCSDHPGANGEVINSGTAPTEGRGPQGSTGTISLTLFGSTAHTAQAAIHKAAFPNEKVIVHDIISGPPQAFAIEVTDARKEAIAKNYDTLP